MKNLVLFALALVGLSQSALSQTATGTFTQVPCNNDGIYEVTTTGIPLPITYTYYLETGVVVHANINSTTDQLTNIPMSNYGYLYCEVQSGSIFTYAQTQYTPSFGFEVFGTNPVCPATMGTVTATQYTGTTGPFSYEWTNNQSGLTYSGNNANVPVGQYSVKITDQTTGCFLQISDTAVFIQQESDITATISISPANCTNGSATAIASGGTPPYTYLWANGSTNATATGLSLGTHSLTITDAQGCQSNFWPNITQSVQINVNTSVTNATCVQNDGSAIAFGSGGVNPYTYSWDNGQSGNTATGLSGGNYYNVIATDANGCIGVGYAYIGSNTPVNVTYSSTASQCTSATGTATLAVNGGTAPYSYLWYSNPSATTGNLNNVSPGSYSFLVTDAVGCTRSGSVYVPPISTVNASIQTSTVICPNTNGTATAIVTSGQAPFTYYWNTGATTNSISGVPTGQYACIVTDNLGCSVIKYGSVQSTSPVFVGVSTVPVTCIYNTDGSVTSSVSGGTAPYSYNYTNGATTANTSNLAAGDYYLTVSDANGCSTSKHFWITNANTSQDCYCTIAGDVYVDDNANCVRDSGEDGVPNVMIHCSGFGYTFTNNAGHYSFQVPSGTYTISEQVNQYYPLAACQTNGTVVNVVASSGCTNTVDFANVINPLHDLKIVTMNSTVPPIPGNPYQQKVIVMNQGTIAESSIQLGYEQDEQIPFVGSTDPNFTQLNSASFPYWYSIQSGFPSLTPGTSSVMLLNYLTPTDIPLGTTVQYFDSVAYAAPIDVNWLLDNSPWNNVQTFEPTVIGAYDPNYKEVSPKGSGAQGFVDMDVKEFDYTIHFQNEGTYFAQNIVVTDQLDADFDWTTFKPGYSDYEYNTTVSETGLVTFTFPNINLPWKSAYGDALSSALVHYSIERKTTNPIGTEFTNTANIYFDYNAPITTNTTLNTLGELAVDDDVISGADGVTVELFPVPASDYLNIRINNVLENEIATVTIVDLTGKIVLSDKLNLTTGSTQVTKSLSGLATGSYLTRIEFEDGSAIVKQIVITSK